MKRPCQLWRGHLACNLTILLASLAAACSTLTSPRVIRMNGPGLPDDQLAVIKLEDPKLQLQEVREHGGETIKPLADPWFGNTGTGYIIMAAPGTYDLIIWYEYVDTIETKEPSPWRQWYIHQKSDSFTLTAEVLAGKTYSVVLDRITDNNGMKFVIKED